MLREKLNHMKSSIKPQKAKKEWKTKSGTKPKGSRENSNKYGR